MELLVDPRPKQNQVPREVEFLANGIEFTRADYFTRDQGARRDDMRLPFPFRFIRGAEQTQHG